MPGRGRLMRNMSGAWSRPSYSLMARYKFLANQNLAFQSDTGFAV
jgi:hypothetical protein